MKKHDTNNPLPPELMNVAMLLQKAGQEVKPREALLQNIISQITLAPHETKGRENIFSLSTIFTSMSTYFKVVLPLGAAASIILVVAAWQLLQGSPTQPVLVQAPGSSPASLSIEPFLNEDLESLNGLEQEFGADFNNNEAFSEIDSSLALLTEEPNDTGTPATTLSPKNSSEFDTNTIEQEAKSFEDAGSFEPAVADEPNFDDLFGSI